MAHDLMRGIKNENFWMMEQQSGPCGWQAMSNTPEPGQIRLWTYQAIAHGAEAMVYFRWRPALFGTEQYWHGVLDHDGIGRRRYKEIGGITKELNQLSKIILGSKNQPQIALIKSYDNVWSHEVQPHNAAFDYNESLYDYYKSCHSLGFDIELTSVEADFSKYKMVIMPNFNLCTEAIKAKCHVYVEGGGHLIVTYRSGTRHWNNQLTEETLPGYFRELTGIELLEYDSLSFGRQVDVVIDGSTWKASKWCDVIDPKGTEVLGSYDSHYYKGEAAVTMRNYGEGKVYYIGCDLETMGMKQLLQMITKQCKMTNDKKIHSNHDEVEIIRKMANSKEVYYVMNHSSSQQSITFEKAFEDVLTGERLEAPYNISGYDVRILCEA
jgi:beta-galactosidase